MYRSVYFTFNTRNSKFRHHDDFNVKSYSITLFIVNNIFGVQLKCGESIAPILPTRVAVEIINRLVDRYLVVQCKDKHNDFGMQQLNVGETFSFRFFPKYYYPSTLFFLSFCMVGRRSLF